MVNTYEIEITGITALLQHRFGTAMEVDAPTRQVKVTHSTPREEAEAVAYRSPDGNLYLPSAAVYRAVIDQAANHKVRGSRKSLKHVISGAIRALEDTITLRDPATWAPLSTYEVDSRPICIPSTKGRVMRHRPRIERWGLRMDLVVNEDLIDGTMVHQLLNEAGLGLGLGDYRPQRFGPFGTFRVTGWSTLGAKVAAK